MKNRTQFFIAISLLILILGVSLFTYSTQKKEPSQIFPATVNRDCAPWDGSAFTVSIPMRYGAIIDISIWKSPDIKFPITFLFPNDTGQVGNVSYRLASGEYRQLSGKVFLWRVEEGSPVEGRFELVTEAGRQFKGQFKADWENQIRLCG